MSCSGAEIRNLPGALSLWACQPAVSMPWPRTRSTSLRSLTRKQIRTSICERSAPCPIAFWVGRWVAAIRVTATARPRRPMESASLVASGADSASSADSSMMITRAGMSGEGSQTRLPRAARQAARVGGGLGAAGVLVNDDHQGGHVGRGFPDPLAERGEAGGAGFEDGHRVGEQGAGFGGGGGQAADAGGARESVG